MVWRCNSFAFTYKKIKVMRCKTCPLYGCGSSKTTPINRAYVCVISPRSDRAAVGHCMSCYEYVRRLVHAQVALLLLLRASGHVSRSVSIYLFSTLALYYTKALSHSLTLCHSSTHCSFFHNLSTSILIHKYFSTSYPQTYPQDNPLAL